MTPVTARGRVGIALAAVGRRDLIVLASYRLQLLLRVVSILVFLASLFFISRLVGSSEFLGAYSGRYFEFALIGVSLITFANLALRTFAETIANEQRAGTLEMLLVTPTRLPTLLAGMFVAPLSLTAVTVAIYLLVAVFVFDARLYLGGAVPALILLALTVATFCAVGIVSAAVIVVTKRGDPIGGLVAQATTVLAGAVFPVAVLPAPLAAAAQVFPAFYGLRGLRELLLAGGGLADVLAEIAVLAGFVVVLLPLALLVFARALRLARTLGTLGSY